MRARETTPCMLPPVSYLTVFSQAYAKLTFRIRECYHRSPIQLLFSQAFFSFRENAMTLRFFSLQRRRLVCYKVTLHGGWRTPSYYQRTSVHPSLHVRRREGQGLPFWPKAPPQSWSCHSRSGWMVAHHRRHRSFGASKSTRAQAAWRLHGLFA
jgi:hypothetical protein